MINWRRFAILTTIRTVAYSAVAAALCVLFPAATPWIIAGGLGSLAIASKVTYDKGKRETRDLQDMGSEAGDWGKMYGPTENGKIEQIELNATIAIDKTLTAIGNKIKSKKKASNLEKQSKTNNSQPTVEEESVDTNIDDLSL